MDICHSKNAELEAKHHKYNGRVVLRGDIVKDDSGAYAVFTEQRSSGSQVAAAKVMDIISRLQGCDGQAADAVSAYTQTPGGDQELRTSTLIRPRPIRGESHLDFLGESEGSLLQPPDSFPDAGEAINDFWSMSGSFIYRHHVGSRVKLYSPREESFPIPLKYIDVTRTTQNLDVKQEKRIDDYWNIDGSRDLSDPWTGSTQFTPLEEKPPD